MFVKHYLKLPHLKKGSTFDKYYSLKSTYDVTLVSLQ